MWISCESAAEWNVEFKVKLRGDEKFNEPYHIVEAETAKDAAELWYGGPLSLKGGPSALRVEVKYKVDGKVTTSLYYEPV